MLKKGKRTFPSYDSHGKETNSISLYNLYKKIMVYIRLIHPNVIEKELYLTPPGVGGGRWVPKRIYMNFQ